MPLLAAWGHAMLVGTFLAWWDKWRKRVPSANPIYKELCSIAAATPGAEDDTVRASPELQR